MRSSNSHGNKHTASEVLRQIYSFSTEPYGYNTRAYLRKIVKMYDAISEKLNEDDSGRFYLQREELGLLYPETAEVERVLEFDEVFRPLYNAHVKTVKRSRYIDFNQGMDARLATDERMKKLSEVNIRPFAFIF